MDELKRFEADLRNDADLRKKYDEACKRVADAGRAKSDGEIVVAAAKELGYEFSIATLEQSRAEGEELDAEELEQIAGGGNHMNEDDYCMFNVHGVWTDGDGHDWWCWTGWHCLATTIHTNETEDEQVTCWSDYLCIFINH